MNKLDITQFLRIQTPLMILAIFMLFMGILFYTPDWVLGIEKLYPPYPMQVLIEQVPRPISNY
jgi:hypothetical protein